MAANGTRESPIRFDLFELDTYSCQLRRCGLPVDLPPQAFRLLRLLAERPNELVTRDEIKHALWPDESHGDFDSRLNFAIKKLREALGDNADRPRYIQTERKAGYRFIAPVTPVRELSADGAGALAAYPAATAAPAAHPGPREAVGSAARKPLGWVALVTGVMVLLSITAIGSFVLRRSAEPVASAKPSGGAGVDDSKPEISSVTPILPQATQRIVIRGRGFGLHVSYARTDSPYLAIRDNTAHWAAGRIVPHNYDDVMLDVESWSDDQIVVTGFSGEYGKNTWRLTAGDQVDVAVWNPQNGVGPAIFHTKVIPPKPEK